MTQEGGREGVCRLREKKKDMESGKWKLTLWLIKALGYVRTYVLVIFT